MLLPPGGTGKAFRKLARQLVGVDLSKHMLARANRTITGVYDLLIHRDIVETLRHQIAENSVDLIVAAGIFNFWGDLDEIMALCARALRDGGFLAFTTVAAEYTGRRDKEWWRLQVNREFAHSKTYLERALNHTGFVGTGTTGWEDASSKANYRRDRGHGDSQQMDGAFTYNEVVLRSDYLNTDVIGHVFVAQRRRRRDEARGFALPEVGFRRMAGL